MDRQYSMDKTSLGSFPTLKIRASTRTQGLLSFFHYFLHYVVPVILSILIQIALCGIVLHIR